MKIIKTFLFNKFIFKKFQIFIMEIVKNEVNYIEVIQEWTKGRMLRIQNVVIE